MLHPTGKTNPLPQSLSTPHLTLAIGPEGGFSETESQCAQQAQFQLLALGPRILRTETATAAAVSLAQWLWGDW